MLSSFQFVKKQKTIELIYYIVSRHTVIHYYQQADLFHACASLLAVQRAPDDE